MTNFESTGLVLGELGPIFGLFIVSNDIAALPFIKTKEILLFRLSGPNLLLWHPPFRKIDSYVLWALLVIFFFFKRQSTHWFIEITYT